MLEQRTTDQNQEVEEKNMFLGMLSCIRGFTVQKECIHMHTLSQDKKDVWDEKLRKLR